MRTVMMLLAVSLAVGAGCKKKEGGADQGSAGSAGSGSAGSGSSAGSAGSGSAAAGSDTGSGSAGAGSGSAGSGSGNGSDLSAGAGSGDAVLIGTHHALNCPSTVVGSNTTAVVQGKSIVLTITAGDAAAIGDIQKRAAELLDEKKDGQTGMAHDHKGTHGGSVGICPVYVPEGATASAKNDAKGVLVTITPKDNLDALKTDIDGRIGRAADWLKSGGATKGGGAGTGGGGGKGTGGGSGAGSAH